MKKKFPKVVLLITVVLLAVICLSLVACDKKAKTHTVTIMDGDEVLATVTVDHGSVMVLPTDKLKIEGKIFKGLYNDKECTDLFVYDKTDVEGDLTVYAKFEAGYPYYLVIRDENDVELSRVGISDVGKAYTLVKPTKTGYTCTGFTYEDEAFAESGTFTWTKTISVKAVFTPNTYKVFLDPNGGEFVNASDLLTDEETGAKYKTVTYDQAYTLPEVSRYGYNPARGSGWNNGTAAFVKGDAYDVAEDITLVAQWTPKTSTLIVEGWNEVRQEIAFGSSYRLPNPVDETDEDMLALLNAKVGGDNEWTTFSGYTKNDDAFAYTGTCDWEGTLEVQAVYEENPLFGYYRVYFHSGPISKSILIDASAEDKTIPAAAYPEAFPGWTVGSWCLDSEYTRPFDTESEITESIHLYATYTANVYTITYKYTDDGEEYEVFDTQEVSYSYVYSLIEVSRPSYRFVKFLFDGEEVEVTTNLTYDTVGNIEYVIVWEKLEQKGSLVFDEEDYKVLLTGQPYHYPDEYALSTESDCVTITEGNFVTPTKPSDGTFLITLTPKAGGEVQTRKVKTVYTLNAMFNGNDYMSMLNSSTKEGVFQKKNVASEYVIEAGVNDFRPDISLKSDAYKNLSYAEANIILTAKDAEENDVTSKVAVTNDLSYALDFDASLVGKTVTLTMRAKYDPYTTPFELSMKVKLNDGVNVYNNDQMRTAYGDPEVQTINVLRNIKGKIRPEDYDLSYGGSSEYRRDVTLSDGTVIKNVDCGSPYNDYGHSLYVRTVGKEDRLVINGNYYSIDGTDLPYIDNAHDEYGADGSEYANGGGGYRVANVQLGIFLYRCGESNEDGIGMKMRWADGSMTVNNLRLHGNNLYSATATEDLKDGNKNPLIKMSASYDGMVIRGGTVNLNNVTMEDFCMGIMTDGRISGYNDPGHRDFAEGYEGQAQPGETQACHLNLDSCIIDNSWGTAVLAYDLAAITMRNTKITHCNGPAIQETDHAYAEPGKPWPSEGDCWGYSNLNTTLVMDVYTANHIQNWVNGDEAWFTAYGFNEVALGLKSMIEEGVNGAGYTIFGEEGTQRMNFAILAMPGNVSLTWTVTPDWQADKDGRPNIDTYTNEVLDAGDGKKVQIFATESEFHNLAFLQDNQAKITDALTAKGYAEYFQAQAQAAVAAGDYASAQAYGEQAQNYATQAYGLQEELTGIATAYGTTLDSAIEFYNSGKVDEIRPFLTAPSEIGGIRLWIALYPKAA